MSKQVPKTPRRSSSGVREDHVVKGAFLVELEMPEAFVDMFRGPIPVGLEPTLLAGKELQSERDRYRTMERKGFRVTKDTGCLLPDPQYCTNKEGSTVKGYHRAFTAFAGWRPKAGNLRNEFGWPSTPQISHLCHRRNCCRIDHLVAEEQWRNLKRNYCGYSGQCDCGSTVECLRRYQPGDQTDSPELCSTKAEVREALADCPLSFVVHSADRHANRDRKAAQRKDRKVKRKRAQDKHEHATEKKRARAGEGGPNQDTTGQFIESSDDEEQGDEAEA